MKPKYHLPVFKGKRIASESSRSEDELLQTFSDMCQSYLSGISIFADTQGIDAPDLCGQVKFLIDRYPSWQFAIGVKRLNLSKFDEQTIATFYAFCYHFLNTPLSPVTREHFISARSEEALNHGKDELLASNLIVSIAVHDRDASETKKDNYMLSEKACAALFKGREELIKASEVSNYGQFVPWKEIAVKELYFTENLHARLEKLAKTTSLESYPRIVNALTEHGVRGSVGVLLYGPPGTGKTEMARQIARKNKRNILLADASKLSMAYFGEAPRAFRGLFRLFRYVSAISVNPPILFLDEADGILSRRVEISRAVDKEANEVSNIILEELNTFSGIVFATTNLLDNMDPAVFRRFLFKIEVPFPDVKTRMRIWRQKIPWISNADVLLLAEQFELSGGQIDNIASLCIIDSIIDDRRPSIKEISSYCEEQSATGSRSRRKIGFQQ